MKCNKCGQENMMGASFCSTCGNALSGNTVTPPPTTPVTGNFNNLNANAQTKKNPAHVVMIVECIVGVIFLVAIAALIIWLVTSKNKIEALSCSQETPAVSESFTYTFNGNEMIKAERTYIWDKTVEDDDSAFGVAMIIAMKDELEAEYKNEPGVEFKISDGRSIATISYVIDMNAVDASTEAEILDDIDGKTLSELKTAAQSEGFTCTVK